MSIKLQLRRGLETDLPTLAVGEQGFCTDSYKLFIGSAGGNKGVAMLDSPTFTSLVTVPNTISATVGPIRNARTILLHDFQHPTGGGAIPSGHNIFIGDAGNFTMGSTATEIYHGSWNVNIGYLSLRDNIIGSENVSVGAYTLVLNTTGRSNTAVGVYALQSNATGLYNTAIGSDAMNYHSTGDGNTVIGYRGLFSNVSGSGNVAIGYGAGYWETGQNRLFIDYAVRSSEADGRVKALVYGIFDTLTANQRLSVNARLLVRECPNYANNAAALAGGLVSGELYTVTGTDPLQVAKVI